MKKHLLSLIIVALCTSTAFAQSKANTRSAQIISLISKTEDDQIRFEQYRFDLASRISSLLLINLRQKMYEERLALNSLLNWGYGGSALLIAMPIAIFAASKKINEERESCSNTIKTARALLVLSALSGVAGLASVGLMDSNGVLEPRFLKTKQSAEVPKDVYDSVSLLAELMQWDLSDKGLVRSRADVLNDFSFLLTRDVILKSDTTRPTYHTDILSFLKRENLLTTFEDMNFQRTRRLVEGAKKASDFFGLTEKEALRKSEAKKALKQFEEFLNHTKEVWARNASRWPQAESNVAGLLSREETALQEARQSLGL